MGLPALLFLLLWQGDPYAEGMKALEARDYPKAVELFTKAAAADPKDYAAHFHIGLANSLQDKNAEAAAAYRKVLEMKPGLYEAELNLGIVLLEQKDAAGAAPLLKSAAEKKPGEFRPVFYLAQSLLESGDHAGAAQWFEAAAKLNEKSAAAALGWGQALARQNQVAAAAPHYRRAAELDPAYRDALLELAALHEKAGQFAEAIAIYEGFPGNAAAQERMGQLLAESQRFSEAIPRLEEAVKKDPTPANLLALANAYRGNREPDKAMPLLEKAVAAEPANFDLKMFYGRALRDQRNFPAAARQFHDAIKLKPDAKEAWNEIAGALILLEQFPQALAALDRAQHLGETNPALDYFRAITLDKLKIYKDALDAYKKFLANSQGKSPDEEFKSRQRMRIIEKELSKR